MAPSAPRREGRERSPVTTDREHGRSSSHKSSRESERSRSPARNSSVDRHHSNRPRRSRSASRDDRKSSRRERSRDDRSVSRSPVRDAKKRQRTRSPSRSRSRDRERRDGHRSRSRSRDRRDEKERKRKIEDRKDKDKEKEREKDREKSKEEAAVVKEKEVEEIPTEDGMEEDGEIREPRIAEEQKIDDATGLSRPVQDVKKAEVCFLYLNPDGCCEAIYWKSNDTCTLCDFVGLNVKGRIILVGYLKDFSLQAESCMWCVKFKGRQVRMLSS